MSGTTVIFEMLTPEEKDGIVRAALAVVVFYDCGAILPTSDEDQEAQAILDWLVSAVRAVEVPA